MNGPRRRLVEALLNLEKDLDDAFASVIDHPWGRGEGEAWAPAVDLHETDAEYVVHVDLPGLCEGDIRLRVEEHEVTVFGVRRETRSVESATRVHIERRAGAFRRTIVLEHAVDPHAVTARCENGEYEIRLGKQETNREEEDA